MNTIKNFTAILFVICLVCFVALPATGQTAMTTTTLSSAVTCTGSALNPNCPTIFNVASATNIVAPGPNNSNRTLLYIDKSAYLVRAVNGTSITVIRGAHGTYGRASHLSGATVFVGKDTDQYFVDVAPQGACTATNYPILPVIELTTGKSWTCSTIGKWGQLKAARVPAADCTYAPTTLTTTNVLTYIGASTLLVSQGTSNAAAGTLTLTCDVWPSSIVGLGQGAIIQDITLFVGSQTTAPTSLGTSTLGSITFPAAATTETASTVTPVAVGGTVTTVSPTAITSTTTAGAFLSIKTSYATIVQLNTDLQVLRYTLPFVQSAAAAMVINTPGLLVHYVEQNQ